MQGDCRKMVKEDSSGSEEESGEERFSDEGDSSPEDGFTEGYMEDDKVEECAQCGIAVKAEKKVAKEIDSEEYTFCSKQCANEFEEEMA